VVAISGILATGCGRPYHQKKNGDVDVQLLLKRTGCNGSQSKEKACKLLHEFDEASSEVASPGDEAARYLGWFSPIGPGGTSLGDAVALVLVTKNGRTEATLIVTGKTGDDATRAISAFLREKVEGGDQKLERFFKTEEVSRRLDRVEGSPSARLQMIDQYTYVRRDEKRLLIVHTGSTENTSMHYGYTKAPVWVGELRRFD